MKLPYDPKASRFLRRNVVKARPIIRALRHTDFQGIKKIERLIIQEYLQFLKNTGENDTIAPWISRDYFTHYIKQRSSFVAEADGKIVGFILAQPTKFLQNRSRELWLDYIAVVPEIRRTGIGSNLLSQVIRRARSKRIQLLHTSLNPNNNESARFLEKHGFKLKNWTSAMKLVKS